MLRLKLALVVLFCCIASLGHAAGLQLIEVPADAGGPALKGAVWYPCAAKPEPTKLTSLLSVPAAKDCPIEGEKLPLVVISHGRGGWLLRSSRHRRALRRCGLRRRRHQPCGRHGDRYEPDGRPFDPRATTVRHEAARRLHARLLGRLGIVARRAEDRCCAHRLLRLFEGRLYGPRPHRRQTRFPQRHRSLSAGCENPHVRAGARQRPPASTALRIPASRRRSSPTRPSPSSSTRRP